MFIHAVTVVFASLAVAALTSTTVRMFTRGALKRGSMFGVKSRHTLKSDEAWHEGHVAAVPLLKRSALVGWLTPGVVLVTAFFLPFFGVPMVLTVGMWYVMVGVQAVLWVMASYAAYSRAEQAPGEAPWGGYKNS